MARNWEVFAIPEYPQLKRAEYGCHDCGEKLAIKKNGKPASRCLKHLIECREKKRQVLGCKRRYSNATHIEGAKQ